MFNAYKNQSLKTTGRGFTGTYLPDYFLGGRCDFLESCHNREVAKQPAETPGSYCAQPKTLNYSFKGWQLGSLDRSEKIQCNCLLGLKDVKSFSVIKQKHVDFSQMLNVAFSFGETPLEVANMIDGWMHFSHLRRKFVSSVLYTNTVLYVTITRPWLPV